MRHLLPLVLLAACGSTPNRPLHQAAPSEARPTPTMESAVAEPEGTSASDPVVAIVGGQPITTRELLGAWLHRESRQVRGYVEELILSRLVMLEAARLGIIVPQSALDEALNDATDHLREQVRQAGGEMSVDEFLERRLGLDAQRYLVVLREQTAIDLYASRAVRAWLLGSDRAEVRVILTDAQDKASAARAALDAGEDFVAVCGRYSVEANAAEGGRVPPVVRGATAMARLAFSTPIGGIGGPVEEGGRWLLLKVDGRPSPRAGTWDDLGPVVEASLAEQGIEDPEYWQWKNWVFEQYEVDMSPLLELAEGVLVD